MTEANQKKLYDNFVRLSKEGKNEAQRVNCAKYAANILKSFPDFANKKTVTKTDTNTDTLTPAQKAAATKKANKEAKEAENSQEEGAK